MHILWFDHGFSCPAGSGGTRTYDFARSMAMAGHRITLVCAAELISSSGLDGPFVHDRREGPVDGMRIVEFNFAGETSLLGQGRIRLRYAAFIIRLLFARYDLVVSTTRSMQGILPGLLARLLRRKPFVFEIDVVRSGAARALQPRNPFARGLSVLIERGACRFASKIVAASEDIAESVRRLGVEPFNLAVIPDFCDPAAHDEAEIVHPSALVPGSVNPGNLVAVFAGRFSPEYEIEPVLDAATLLAQHGRQDISILLIGEGPQRSVVAAAAAARGLSNVTIAPPVSKQELPSVLAGCDIGLQVLSTNPEIHNNIASENFPRYLAAGLPVLINYPGWAAGLVAQKNLGFAVRPNDPAAFANALEQAAGNRSDLAVMAHNVAEIRKADFDRRQLTSAFRKIVEMARTEAETRSGQAVKRLLDFSFSLGALMLMAPVLAVLWLLVRLGQGRPVFYREIVPGLFGRPVQLVRFRTLRDAYRVDGGILTEDERHTPIGRFIDRWSLSGLPMLWNVLRGELSFIGPEVLQMQDLSRLSSDEFRRQFVRPGLTGWAQTQKRQSDLILAEDLWYVDNRSLALDMRVLRMTIVQFITDRMPLTFGRGRVFEYRRRDARPPENRSSENRPSDERMPSGEEPVSGEGRPEDSVAIGTFK